MHMHMCMHMHMHMHIHAHAHAHAHVHVVLLGQVARCAEANRMDVANLAIVIAPNIARPEIPSLRYTILTIAITMAPHCVLILS